MNTRFLPEALLCVVREKMHDYYPDDLIDAFANNYSAFVVHGNCYVILLRDAVLTADLLAREVSIAYDLQGFIGQFFEIYPYENDYILYGEVEIVRLSASFEVL